MVVVVAILIVRYLNGDDSAGQIGLRVAAITNPHYLQL